MVPMLTCGLLRSNFAFATAVLLRTLLMRHATSGTDSGRQGVGGWIWTGFSVEPRPVTVEVRNRPPSRLCRVRMAAPWGQSARLFIQLCSQGHRAGAGAPVPSLCLTAKANGESGPQSLALLRVLT